MFLKSYICDNLSSHF